MSETVVDDPTAPLSVTDPLAAQAALASFKEAAMEKFPEAPSVDPDLVTFPGGLVVEDRTIRTARVRELTGEHEEKIYRALQSRNPFHLLSVVLECGVERIGDEPEKDTARLLNDLVVGDREALLIGIRCATYDDTLEVFDWRCPECEEVTDKITLNLREDIEVKKSEDPASAIVFRVPLRKGGEAIVRLPNGSDQRAVAEDANRNASERSTVLLQRCISEIVKPDGTRILLAAFPSYARQLGVVDRRKITEAIAERQPGPQYNNIKLTHEACGKEVALAVNLADLFLQ